MEILDFMDTIGLMEMSVIDFSYMSGEEILCTFTYSPNIMETESSQQCEELKHRLQRIEKGLEDSYLYETHDDMLGGRITGLIKRIKVYGEKQLREEQPIKKPAKKKRKKIIDFEEAKYSCGPKMSRFESAGNFSEENISYELQIDTITKKNNPLVKILEKGTNSAKAEDMIGEEMYAIMKKLEKLGKVKLEEIERKSRKVVPITEHPKFKRKIKNNLSTNIEDTI